MYKAFRRKFEFTQNVATYEEFLKNHITEANPIYRSIDKYKDIITVDGPMCAVHIVDDINDPNLEIIVECILNGQFLYLWRDQCWMVAVNEYGQDVHSRIYEETKWGSRYIDDNIESRNTAKLIYNINKRN